ncbi:MAG: hypothetical protein U1F06_10550 [Steroidobacteraceae bacterium]
MKSLTSRSSSEWKLITAGRPPGASSASAASRPRASAPSSSLMKMRSAWKVRVARVLARLAGAHGALTAQRGELERTRQRPEASRARTMASAMRPAKRSSP